MSRRTELSVCSEEVVRRVDVERNRGCCSLAKARLVLESKIDGKAKSCEAGERKDALFVYHLIIIILFIFGV